MRSIGLVGFMLYAGVWACYGAPMPATAPFQTPPPYGGSVLARCMACSMLKHARASADASALVRANPDDILPRLHAVREASDQGLMTRKAILLSTLMRERPGDWMVDSDPRDPYPGITHTPTGYRFHAPQRIIPPQILEPAMAEAMLRAQGLG